MGCAQIHQDVSPDCLLVLRAAWEIIEQEGFEKHLNSVRDRIVDLQQAEVSAWSKT